MTFVILLEFKFFHFFVKKKYFVLAQTQLFINIKNSVNIHRFYTEFTIVNFFLKHLGCYF